MKNKILSFLVLVLVLCKYTYAQELNSNVVNLNLKDTVNLALTASEEFKIKLNDVKKSEGMYVETRAGILPSANSYANWTKNTDYPITAEKTDNSMAAGVSVSQVLFSFGKIINSVDSAKFAWDASKFLKDASKEDVIYSAKLTYYGALLAKDSLYIAEQSYNNALKNKKFLEERSFGGRSSKHEILKMDADIAGRLPTVNEAKANFGTALEALKIIIDAKNDNDINLIENFKLEYEDLNYENLAKMMCENEPTLKSLDKLIDAAKAKVRGIQAGYLPTLSAFGSFEKIGGSNKHSFVGENSMDRYTAYGLKITMPLWEGGAREGILTQAVADRENAILRRKQVEENLLFDLNKACLEYKQYKESLKANIDAVRLAKESFEQMQAMFASGQITLTDLNDAELLLTKQLLNKEITLYNLNIAFAKIQRLIMGSNNG